MTIIHGEAEGNEVDVQGSASVSYPHENQMHYSENNLLRGPRKITERRKFCMPPTCTSITNKNFFVTWLICNETEEWKCRNLIIHRQVIPEKQTATDILGGAQLTRFLQVVTCLGN
jgi:hypothetical protein